MKFGVVLAGLWVALAGGQSTGNGETSLRQLFVVGDSISIQYGPYLEGYLEGVLQYDRKSDDGGAPAGTGVYEGPNGGDSRSVAGYLESRARDDSFKPDYLLVNCGLHDIRRTLGEDLAYQVSPGDYRENLEKIYTVSRKIGAQLIWVRTTYLVDSNHNRPDMEFHRYAADQEKYNLIADEFFKSMDVPILDLNGFTRTLGENIFVDHVHFNEEVQALQGAFIAGFLSRHIQAHPND
jgi:lysophospholipase L1-like esterase